MTTHTPGQPGQPTTATGQPTTAPTGHATGATTPVSHAGHTTGRQVAAGVTSIAAAALLITSGIVGLLQGIAGVSEDELFVVGPQYTYEFDLTTWGWIHIVLGVLLIVTGLAVITGATWARVTAIGLACLSIIGNFLWLPYYPLWSIIVIALDAVVIWALATWNPERL
ncbi:hypothetical protein REK76_14950 [Nocardia farcinica]|uniref:DUF7144 family membrane protein n=1 Tax=Nocardia farcinica TaxID=37329 RepID=UPI00311EEDD2